MASGSSGRGSNSGSKAFDFASDDILCSYEDYGNQDANNGTHSDPSIAGNHSKEFHKSRMSRSSVLPSATYSPPEESSFNQDVLSTVENTMKKYADNLMRFLEGISSRLSQLELYCYNLDNSVKEMRSDLVHDHGESESKLKSLEKHIQEVHRSIQVLRDKQELADTQKELSKLQLAQKESSSGDNTQKNEDKSSPGVSEAKTSENSSNVHNQQLTLALPHQVAPQPSLPARTVDHQQPPMAPQSSIPPQSTDQVQTYYLSAAPQMTNLPAPPQPLHTHQYLPAQSQIQDPSSLPPQPAQSQVNPNPQAQLLPQYQQLWAQQPHHQVQPPQQPGMQQQIRSSSQPVYSTYLPTQPNQSLAGMAPNSMPMQISFAGASQPGPTGPQALHYGEPNKPYEHGGTGRPIQQQPLKTGYETQSVDGYVLSGPRTAPSPGSPYVMYESEGGRAHHRHHPSQQLHFQQSPYPPTSSIPLQDRANNMVGPQSVRAHPYNELIEKLVNMGYRSEHVLGVIQRLEGSGQPVDFNAVLDRLNGQSSGGSQRGGWSG